MRESSLMRLPDGVVVHALASHRDLRGSFTEVFRHEWDVGVAPVQWNACTSETGSLRGVHVHPRHDDYFILVKGRMTLALRDLRRGSSTEGLAALVEMNEDPITAIVIPHGVAHGFYYHEPSLHLYAVSEYWDVEDELGCHWADPELGIAWPAEPTLISERDATAPPLARLLEQLEPLQPIGAPAHLVPTA
jgi:dTDP-4-dehydrorhamnose 3,5-epimerase